jgi:hypothetical protein
MKGVLRGGPTAFREKVIQEHVKVGAAITNGNAGQQLRLQA